MHAHHSLPEIVFLSNVLPDAGIINNRFTPPLPRCLKITDRRLYTKSAPLTTIRFSHTGYRLA